MDNTKLDQQWKGRCASCQFWTGFRVCHKHNQRRGSGSTCDEYTEIEGIEYE